MKKFTFLFLGIFFIYAFTNPGIAYSASTIRPTHASASLQYLKAREFIKLSPKEFASLTGKKLNIWDRLSFKINKMRMKHELKKNPELTIGEYYTKNAGKSLSAYTWIKIGLGVILIVIAIILATNKN